MTNQPESVVLVPNYDIECLSCGQTPTVDLKKKDGSIHHMDLCGPCCFGEADMKDVENW